MDDPLIALILEYERQIVRFNAGAPEQEDESDAFAERTFQPVYLELVNHTPVPTTMAGVIKGLEYAHCQMLVSLDSEMPIAIVRVCISFLKQLFFREFRIG